MLGRNAARPLVGMSPSRLVAAYSAMASSHRLAHWMLSKPYTMLHMHRYLFLSPQLLLTNAVSNTNNNNVIGGVNVGSGNGHATTLVSLDGSSACQLHTTPSPLAQPQLLAIATQEILLPADLYTPYIHGTATAETSASASAAAAVETTDAEAVTAELIVKPVSNNSVIAYNYLLAASWHPKSRQRQPQLLLQQQQQQQQQDMEDAANAERTLRWKQKLRAVHPQAQQAQQAQTHPGRVDAGEDAFFHVSTPSRVALGVADGVGGWSEMGVDPALFSWALMNNAENIARLTDSVPPPSSSSSSSDASDNNTAATNVSFDADESAALTAAAAAAAAAAGGERKVLDAQSILDGAYSELVQSGTVEAGSSTACILSLCKRTGTLRASNLGDSAFLLIRDNKCIYESPSQQHFWNCPYQLTVLPPKLRQSQPQPQTQPQPKHSGKVESPSNSSMSGDSDNQPGAANKTSTTATTTTRRATKVKKAKYVQDLPKDAVQTTHQLQDGDVIVLATDGFWDNVFTKEAIELVDRELGDLIREEQRLRQIRQQLRSRTDITTMSIEQMVPETMTADEVLARVRALSKRLTSTARRFSLDSKRMTPFSQGARHIQCGGKIDDITVIVTLVRSTINL